MKYDPEIHHRRSIRLKEYDYSQDGYYFVTICVKNMECLLGDVVGGKMVLSNIGEIVKEYWVEIPKHFNNVLLDVFVVMPNHVHGIVVIDDYGVVSNVGARYGMPLQQFGMSISNSLPMIVNHFKSAVKRWCNKNNHEYFQWQRNYHERIIRNEKELYYKRRYIINNPLNWKLNCE